MLEPTTRWELYRALSEPLRLRLLALVAEEELAIGELAELLGEAQPNVSRHVAPLRQAGIIAQRREGTRSLVSLRDDGDAVVRDAVASGRAMCETDGSLDRLAEIVRARDAMAKDYFERPSKSGDVGPPSETAALLAALAVLIPDRRLAIDAGTGDGALLEVLSPVFERVIAIDRSEAQLAFARARTKARGFSNVELLKGELDAPAITKALKDKADAVFAVRLLHHAPRPQEVLVKLCTLVRPGGDLIVLDYAAHDDEQMREHADVWLGFEPKELERLAKRAGFESARATPIPAPFRGTGPDSHLPWQVLSAKKGGNGGAKPPNGSSKARPSGGETRSVEGGETPHVKEK